MEQNDKEATSREEFSILTSMLNMSEEGNKELNNPTKLNGVSSSTQAHYLQETGTMLDVNVISGYP